PRVVPRRIMSRRIVLARRTAAALALGVALAACSSDDGTAEARPTSGGAGAAAPAGGPAAGGGPGAGGGRGGGMTVVLSAGDVAAAVVDTIEATIAVTGDLRPIEQVNVRARIEGDVDAVLVREGDRVSQGQLLARFEASEEEADRESALAERAAARSEVATAQWNAEQSAELFRAGAIAEQADRAAQQQLAAARARLAAAEARVRATSATARDTRVVAPTTGVIAARSVEAGEHVARGAALFTLVRNDRLELAASVPARQASEIRPGQTVRFVADGQALEGRVARVSPTINPATRSIEVYLQLPNPGGRLKGNTFATGRIIGRTIPDAVLVPVAAIRQSGEGGSSFAYRVGGDDVVERVPVTTGVSDPVRGVVQVIDGLAAGDRVIVGNVGAIGAGSRVQIVGEKQ
ncbi:MAG TPA: efflux RND transporter periplasmic adaptor subunit, partial [Gemmatimonadaceae bacterium]|nr:efflux RND transporter periplasmic adaptor subunit [Gemmatimonadaceae bacterium]